MLPGILSVADGDGFFRPSRTLNLFSGFDAMTIENRLSTSINRCLLDKVEAVRCHFGCRSNGVTIAQGEAEHITIFGLTFKR